MAFSNAHNFEINSGYINNVHIINHSRLSSPDERQMDILHRSLSIDATDKSASAAYATKCKPGTRVAIIADIMDWVATPTSRFLWLSGPAGGGKTCIIREVVTRCKQGGLPTCTYFFSARNTGLNNERPFISTIVYQLIASFPELKPKISEAISGNPGIFEESLDSQMDTLLQPNLGRLDTDTMVIVIDSLDECRKQKERQHLLQLLHTLVHELSSLVLIIIASRPEFDLRMAFSNPQFIPILRTLRLHDYDGKEDVRRFYYEEFERIRTTHPLRRSIPYNWPTEEIQNALVDKSSGYFLLPTETIRYIDNPRRNPVAMLENIMAQTPSPNAEHPLANVDTLYSSILNPPYTDIQLMKKLLHSIIGLKDAKSEDSHCTPPFLDNFLQLAPGMVETNFRDLHSILSIPGLDSKHEDEPIYFHHESMADYLTSSERSKDLFQSSWETQLDLALTCIRHLQIWNQDPCVVAKEDPAYYASQKLDDHLRLCLESLPDPTSLPDDILQFDARIIWKCFFVGPARIFPIRATYNAFHSAICEDGFCSPFCRLLSRMDRCIAKAQLFAESMGRLDAQARLEALPRFATETGLYSDIDDDQFGQPQMQVQQLREQGPREPPKRRRQVFFPFKKVFGKPSTT